MSVSSDGFTPWVSSRVSRSTVGDLGPGVAWQQGGEFIQRTGADLSELPMDGRFNHIGLRYKFLQDRKWIEESLCIIYTSLTQQTANGHYKARIRSEKPGGSLVFEDKITRAWAVAIFLLVGL
ncbi:MAG TPA: hypothetical protein VK901_03830 [Nitrospiraceae bacterium]|nr:hypothetical protein [Nitrospiraceae bacterium]